MNTRLWICTNSGLLNITYCKLVMECSSGQIVDCCRSFQHKNKWHRWNLSERLPVVITVGIPRFKRHTVCSVTFAGLTWICRSWRITEATLVSSICDKIATQSSSKNKTRDKSNLLAESTKLFEQVHVLPNCRNTWVALAIQFPLCSPIPPSSVQWGMQPGLLLDMDYWRLDN